MTLTFLVKHRDDDARALDDFDVTSEKPLSVLTNQTMDEIKVNYEHVWTEEGAMEATKKKQKRAQSRKASMNLPKGLKKIPFPNSISPQLATLVDKAPEGDQWMHEIKFDGYRILAFVKDNIVSLKSRNKLDWTSELETLAQDIKKLSFKDVVLDGEVVLLDKEGKSDFQLLQNTIKSGRPAHFIYYVFDILYYDGFNLKPIPLIQRKAILRTLLPEKHSSLFYSDHIINNGNEIFHHSCELALEGIISKKIDSTYETKRSKSWLKVKCMKRQEFVIGGYTNPQGSRSYFGSLFLGVYNAQGELEYAGNVGTGFTEKSLNALYEQLKQVASKINPFSSTLPDARKAHWVEPTLIAEVEFTQWTHENHLRHPSFKGLRTDKKAKDVVRERATPLKKVKKNLSKKVSDTHQMTFESSNFTITHPEKIVYPEDKITKQDVLHYYEMVCDYILPYIENRPLSLVRCPENYQECFFQRHYNKMTAKALKSFEIVSKDENKPYIYLNDREGLLSLVQMGVLEIHPWGSLISSLETPDIIVIDLDPAPDVTWKTIVAAALEIKAELAQFNLTSYVKTTGGKGLHVVLPIQLQYDWEDIKNFTQVFVEYLEMKKPNLYISKMTKSKRVGKIFVDYLRNQRSATAIGTYSTRSRVHAPVSVPIEWDELTNRRRDTDFTIKTVPKRLNNLKKDPWEGFWSIKQQLPLADL